MPDPGVIATTPDGLVSVSEAALVTQTADEPGQGCCCEIADAVWYYVACPCIGYEGPECQVADAPCIFIDARSRLSDSQTPLGEREASGIFATWDIQGGRWIVTTIVQVNGVCYSLMGVTRFSNTPGVGIPLPAGSITYGGPGVVIDKRANCVDGCAPVNVGGTHYEIFPCDGCRGPFTARRFVCARAVFGWTVVAFGPAAGGAWCINRSTIYTQAQATQLGVIVTVNPILITADVGGYLGRVPAWSCCFGVSIPQCTPPCNPRCLRGITYKNFSRGYGLIDVCCGRKAEFSYAVGMSYNRVTTYPPNAISGFVLVMTEVGSVASVEQDTTDCGYVLITVNQSQSNNAGYSDSSQFVVRVRKRCCLDYPETGVSNFPGWANNTFVPYPQVYESNGVTFNGFVYQRKIPWYNIPNPLDSVRQGWFESGWGFVFQISGQQPDSSAFSASGTSGGDCNSWSFNFSENQSWADGRSQVTSASLTIRNVTSGGSPCSDGGSCGPGGFVANDIGSFFL